MSRARVQGVPSVMAVLLGLADPALAQGQVADQIAPGSATAPNRPIIVKGRRIAGPLDAIRPEREYGQEEVAAQGLSSIQEVIDRLASLGSNAPHVVINGRRVGSVQQLLSLPPEALAKLQVYPPGQGAKFGYAGTAGLVNVVLKQRFNSTLLTGNGAVLQGIGGARGTLTAQMVALRGTQRTIASATLSGTERLLASAHRVPAASPVPASPADRTLIAGSTAISTAVNLARTVDNVDVALDISASRNRSVTAA